MVNLSTVSQLPAEKLKPLFDDLNRSITLLREIRELLPPWCRYLKISFLLALENAFNVSNPMQNDHFREQFPDGNKVKGFIPGESTLFEVVLEKAAERGLAPDLIGWVEKMESRQGNGMLACFLLDGSGFPLKYTVLSRQKGECLAGLSNLKIRDMRPEFFLAPACERLYNTFGSMGFSEKENGHFLKEIFIFRDPAGSGKTGLNLEKVLLYGPGALQLGTKD